MKKTVQSLIHEDFPTISFNIPDYWKEDIVLDPLWLNFWYHPKYTELKVSKPCFSIQILPTEETKSNPHSDQDSPTSEEKPLISEFSEIESELLVSQTTGNARICHMRYLTILTEPQLVIVAVGLAPKDDPLIQYEVEQILNSLEVTST